MTSLSGFEHLGAVRTDDDGPPSGRLRTTSAAQYGTLLLCLASLLLACRVFVPPYPEDEILRAKLEHLDRHAGEYDGVFLGSSRIHRGFVPEFFRKKTGLRVFNLGLLYGRPHELDVILEDLLAKHRFRVVFVEVMDWAPSVNADLADQERTIRWHTPRQTVSAVRTTWRAEGSTVEKLGRTGEHAGHLLKRSVNFGGGVPWLRSWFDDGRRHAAWSRTIARGDGFVAYEWETDPLYAREREAFPTKYVDEYRRQVATVEDDNASPGSLAHFNVDAQSEQQERIEASGAEAVFVVPGLRRGTPGWHRLDDDGIVRTLLTFNHPGRYPELYAVENRFDRRHLNTRGALVFTRELAVRLGMNPR